MSWPHFPSNAQWFREAVPQAWLVRKDLSIPFLCPGVNGVRWEGSPSHRVGAASLLRLRRRR